MFGYITINKPQLSEANYRLYRSYYCGLCQALGKNGGTCGKMTLSFDMTFMYILHSGLYEPEEENFKKICPLHPFGNKIRTLNEYAGYAADMNMLLSYYDLLDDWQDDKKLSSLAIAKNLEKVMERIKVQYPRQAKAVSDYVKKLGKLENSSVANVNLDEAAGLTGTMLGEVFCAHEDEWANVTRRIGFYLGKFIYLMDAFEDMARDKKKGSYNPWLLLGHDVSFDEVGEILNMMMGECSFGFEALPILKNAELLRNILYSGVWVKFEFLKTRAAKKTRKAKQ